MPDGPPHVEILWGDCVELMRELPEATFDAVVTDPPYGLEFMGEEWDRLAVPRPGNLGGFSDGRKPSFARVMRHLPGMEAWHRRWAAKAFRALKPGGHLVAFGGTRTYHHLACAVEAAGFEIRDQIHWIYAQGFPKSLNLKGAWRGWGTGLKPAHEPIVLARKPLSERSVAANVAQWGAGAMHIDACRILGPDGEGVWGNSNTTTDRNRRFNGSPQRRSYRSRRHPQGRWPANLVLTHSPSCDGTCEEGCPVRVLDLQAGKRRSGGTPRRRSSGKTRIVYGRFSGQENPDGIGPSAGSAARFFYCPKASRKERDAGLAWPDPSPSAAVDASPNGGPLARGEAVVPSRNHHPTVKPVALMRWLVRLVTPPGGTVLDPFMGSGSTGIACLEEGMGFIGMERDRDYFVIASRRIGHARRAASEAPGRPSSEVR